MFERSLEKSAKLHHKQKQRETSGVLMEQRESYSTIRNPNGPVIPQWNSQTEPQWNSLKIPLKLHSKTPPKRHQSTKIPGNGIQPSPTAPKLHQSLHTVEKVPFFKMLAESFVFRYYFLLYFHDTFSIHFKSIKPQRWCRDFIIINVPLK